MARIIAKFETPKGPRYLEWSTIVDAPVTPAMSLDDFKVYYQHQYGVDGMRGLNERLERVEETGTSSHYGKTVESLIMGNRAGKNESELTFSQLVESYCSDQEIAQ